MVASMDTYICYGAVVAMKLRDDYGISADTLRQPWFAGCIMRYCEAGDDTSTAAFKIANENAVRG